MIILLGDSTRTRDFFGFWENAGNSIYQGMQFSVKKRMSHGFQIGGNYTWSHAIDSGSSWHSGSTTANGFSAGDSVTTDLTMPGLDRGNATFDIRHRFTFNYVWSCRSSRKATDGRELLGRMAMERYLVISERRALVTLPGWILLRGLEFED